MYRGAGMSEEVGACVPEGWRWDRYNKGAGISKGWGWAYLLVGIPEKG